MSEGDREGDGNNDGSGVLGPTKDLPTCGMGVEHPEPQSDYIREAIDRSPLRPKSKLLKPLQLAPSAMVAQWFAPCDDVWGCRWLAIPTFRLFLPS